MTPSVRKPNRRRRAISLVVVPLAAALAFGPMATVAANAEPVAAAGSIVASDIGGIGGGVSIKSLTALPFDGQRYSFADDFGLDTTSILSIELANQDHEDYALVERVNLDGFDGEFWGDGEVRFLITWDDNSTSTLLIDVIIDRDDDEAEDEDDDRPPHVAFDPSTLSVADIKERVNPNDVVYVGGNDLDREGNWRAGSMNDDNLTITNPSGAPVTIKRDGSGNYRISVNDNAKAGAYTLPASYAVDWDEHGTVTYDFNVVLRVDGAVTFSKDMIRLSAEHGSELASKHTLRVMAKEDAANVDAFRLDVEDDFGGEMSVSKSGVVTLDLSGRTITDEDLLELYKRADGGTVTLATAALEAVVDGDVVASTNVEFRLRGVRGERVAINVVDSKGNEVKAGITLSGKRDLDVKDNKVSKAGAGSLVTNLYRGSYTANINLPKGYEIVRGVEAGKGIAGDLTLNKAASMLAINVTRDDGGEDVGGTTGFDVIVRKVSAPKPETKPDKPLPPIVIDTGEVYTP